MNSLKTASAPVGSRINITAAWAAGKGTVSTLKLSYVRAYNEKEAETLVVMLDKGSYVYLSHLNGQFTIEGTTEHVTSHAHQTFTMKGK